MKPGFFFSLLFFFSLIAIIFLSSAILESKALMALYVQFIGIIISCTLTILLLLIRKQKNLQKQTRQTLHISVSILVVLFLSACSQTTTKLSDKKTIEQRHTKEIYNEMGMLLNIYYAEVHPEDSKHRYLVTTKSGQHFEAWIDSRTDSYVFSFFTFKELPLTDTLMWLEKFTLIEPMLNMEQIHELTSTLDKKSFYTKQTEGVNSYHIPFSKGEISLLHYLGEKRMQISFPR